MYERGFFLNLHVSVTGRIVDQYLNYNFYIKIILNPNGGNFLNIS